MVFIIENYPVVWKFCLSRNNFRCNMISLCISKCLTMYIFICSKMKRLPQQMPSNRRRERPVILETGDGAVYPVAVLVRAEGGTAQWKVQPVNVWRFQQKKQVPVLGERVQTTLSRCIREMDLPCQKTGEIS